MSYYIICFMPSYLLNLCFLFPVHITSTLIFKENFSALLLKSCLYHTWSIASSFCGLKFIYIEAAMHLKSWWFFFTIAKYNIFRWTRHDSLYNPLTTIVLSGLQHYCRLLSLLHSFKNFWHLRLFMWRVIIFNIEMFNRGCGYGWSLNTWM